jgi:hypothetical protein
MISCQVLKGLMAGRSQKTKIKSGGWGLGKNKMWLAKDGESGKSRMDELEMGTTNRT